ncbi:MAG: glucosamine-6-phosphate deaminase, partial [Abditibacteriota bacterium]|nr:glucosamine-6-phosphate deaminase [Abditibacteriota bacterium]
REEGLDFSQVVTFNLDEYFPMLPDAPQSYHRFMRHQLFDHINCVNWHVPDGRPRDVEAVERDCEAYEAQIREAGGLDLQLLGIGRTGHIGFNEPGSSIDSRTRLVTLDYLTRADAAGDFYGLENVPVRAITMGLGTILEAREIIMMATGAHKAAIVHEAFEGKITSKVPASFLREHSNALWFVDESAAAELTQKAKPWRAPNADFSGFEMRRRALITAAQELDTPLAKLTAGHLQSVGSGALLHQVASLEAVVQEVERDLQARLDDDKHLPREASVFCLSPHPDDDVICCGATLIKLRERNNVVTVAYGVSGSNAVRDKDVLSLLRANHPRLISYIEDNAPPGQSVQEVFDQIRQEIFERDPGAPDSLLLRNLKRLVREGEAADACRKVGAKPLFLDLPFYYEEQKTVSDEDVERMTQALLETTPDLVLLTGELNDPHGTHELCAQTFERAVVKYFEAGGKPFARWNYRGAWNEYPVWEGSYFSVFHKTLMERKIGLILDHISQLDPVYPGTTDAREFYERARDRNRATARSLQQLGALPPSRSFDPIYAEVFQIKNS